MTWDELITHVRGRWKVAIDAPDRLGLLFRIGEPPEADEQREMVELIHGAGVPYVRITADVAREETLSPLDAVRHNMTLAVGALALDRERYVLRAVLPLDVLSLQALDRSLELLAHEAARIRRASSEKSADSRRLV
ncbi:MAG: hypothetical protein AB7T06_06720 [Kofleriaceae bacterium]